MRGPFYNVPGIAFSAPLLPHAARFAVTSQLGQPLQSALVTLKLPWDGGHATCLVCVGTNTSAQCWTVCHRQSMSQDDGSTPPDFPAIRLPAWLNGNHQHSQTSTSLHHQQTSQAGMQKSHAVIRNCPHASYYSELSVSKNHRKCVWFYCDLRELTMVGKTIIPIPTVFSSLWQLFFLKLKKIIPYFIKRHGQKAPLNSKT